MRSLASLIVFSLLLGSGLAAQTPESLLIGPGDQLHVQIFDSPELEEHARVTDSGEIRLILGGSVKVGGLTPEQAAKSIEGVLLEGHFLLNPRALVNVEQYATQSVTVIGQVRLPGAYPIGTTRNVVEVIALAGGLTDFADRRVLIQRHGTSEKVPYTLSNDSRTALDSAVPIYPGDTIVVPKAGIVYALGNVAHPGAYVMANNDSTSSVLELIAKAGGTPPTAVPSHAKLIRKTENGYVAIALSISKMQKGKISDMQMHPDDIVYVPYSYLKGFAVNASNLTGEVASASIYHF